MMHSGGELEHVLKRLMRANTGSTEGTRGIDVAIAAAVKWYPHRRGALRSQAAYETACAKNHSHVVRAMLEMEVS